jgi:hypothetical protein
VENITFAEDPEWGRKFASYLKQHERTTEALRSLEQEGIPRNWLLEILHDYADPKRKGDGQNPHRTVALSTKRGIDKLLKVLGNTSKSLKAFQGDQNISPWAKAAHVDQFRNLEEKVTQCMRSLRGVRIENAKLATRKGEGVSQELLVILVDAIEGVTGTPRWGDVAYLIEAAYAGHDRTLEADRDLVRKKFKRFCANFPRLREEILLTRSDWASRFGLSSQGQDPSKDWIEYFMDLRPWRNGARTKKTRYGKIHVNKKGGPTSMTEYSTPGVKLYSGKHS